MKHVARKRFGQNFLVSQEVISRIISAIAPQPGETVIEIGPGLGALTQPLLEHVEHLHVVEIDRDLIARLRERFTPSRLTIHEGDALKFDYGSLATCESRLRIVGNLPYNISTPLLFHLAEYADRVGDMHFMLQKEVVDRMVSAPGGREYGRLSVMLQSRFAMERLFLVPPDAFDPVPKVASAIVRMTPLPAADLSGVNRDKFAQVVAAAFGQRRKMLRNTLRDLIDPDELAVLGIRPTCRAEELSVADYVRLCNALKGVSS
ncbi:MAG: 16S rRNA (adenine(1518)-N(6)/adenine(1519)-N(6))-dimethyltransferase RsmA [Betaproteobacteria bacterium]|nr:16S rRNA (adenine(1518)-N(6)/adenine(1519)-N(6))-dimethyltransferase RsmA [Betaproteobacteria bacterium]